MPQQATPTVLTQRIVVLPASRSVSVVNAGPPGPRGEIGPIGYLDENETIGPLIVPDATEPTHALNLRTANALYGPPGTVISGIWASPPPGYSFFGVTITNAQTLYPEFWAEIPVAWRVGSDAVLPSMSDSFLMEASSGVGTKAGSNTHTLSEANLPPHDHSIVHTHTINHDHGSSETDGHSVNHTHGAGTFAAASGGSHSHGAQSPINQYLGTNSGAATSNIGSGGVTIAGSATTAAGGAHTHDVTGTSDAANVSHTHTVDLPNYTGTSGAASPAVSGNGDGSSSPVTHTPAHLKLRFAIRIAA